MNHKIEFSLKAIDIKDSLLSMLMANVKFYTSRLSSKIKKKCFAFDVKICCYVATFI